MTAGSEVCLTFDAEHPDRPWCPPGNLERLLSAVDGVPATFFVQGAFADAYPSAVRRIAEAGHRIGSHSHYHARYAGLTAAGMADDLRRARAAVSTAAGVDPWPLFRLPFGSGAGDQRVERALRAGGWRHCGWDVDSRDWAGGTADQLLGRVLQAVREADSPVLLFHTWPAATADVMLDLVGRLRDDGYRFTTLAAR